MTEEKRLRLLTCWFPVKQVAMIDELVRKGIHISRSEAIRTAVRDMLIQELNLYTTTSKDVKEWLKSL